MRDAADPSARHMLAPCERRLRALMERSAEGFAFVSSSGRFLYVAPSSRAIHGREPEALVGSSALEIVHPDERARLCDDLADLVAAPGSSLSSRLRFRHTDGSYRWLDMIATNLLDDQEIGAIVLNYRDVTQDVAIHEALRASEQRFQAITSVLPLVLWIASRDTSAIEYVSPAYETVWGRSCASLREQPGSWLDAVPPSDRERVSRTLRVPSARGISRADFCIARPSGEIRWIAGAAFRITEPDGRVLAFVGVMEDITDRVQRERRAHRASTLEMIGRLAGGIAHDFNNVLSGVVCAAEALESMPLEDEAREEARAISGFAAHGARLTRHLLTLARGQPSEPVALDLNAVVRASSPILGRLLGASIQIELDLEPALPTVGADEVRIEQVLLNLALNARDAMPEGGRLVLRTQTCEGGARLSVSDSGSGMSAEARARAFEPFYTTKERGSGLGLMTVAHAIAEHGGKIDIDSAPGRGTTFLIELPAWRSRTPPPD